MKSDWFRRPTRFTHKFGGLEERDDPLGSGTWQVPDFPVTRYTGLGPKREIQEFGEYKHRPDPSAVSHPSGGFASLNGPKPDRPQAEGMLWSVGTRWRYGPVDIDEGPKARK